MEEDEDGAAEEQRQEKKAEQASTAARAQAAITSADGEQARVEELAHDVRRVGAVAGRALDLRAEIERNSRRAAVRHRSGRCSRLEVEIGAGAGQAQERALQRRAGVAP